MSDETPTLDSVTELMAGFAGWLIMVTITFILLQQWVQYDFFTDSAIMFIVMLCVTKLFLYVSWICTKFLWSAARTVLLNRDIVRTCRSVWSEWRSQFND